MNDINFFSTYIEKKKKKISTWSRIIVYSILIVLVIGSFYYVTNETIKDLDKQIQIKKNYIESDKITEKVSEILKLKEKLNIVQKNYTKAKSIENELVSKNKINTELLNILEQSKSEEIFDLDTIISTEEVIIEGYSNSKTTIANFEENLRKSNMFKSVHVSIIIKLSEPIIKNNIALNYSFNINCLLIGDKNEIE